MHPGYPSPKNGEYQSNRKIGYPSPDTVEYSEERIVLNVEERIIPEFEDVRIAKGPRKVGYPRVRER
jgi:hypothetical protein